MKTFASLLMALLLTFGINPLAVAEDDWGDSKEDSGDKGDKGDDKGESKEGESGSGDPWKAPPEGDASADEPKGDAEVVIPSSYPVSEINRPLALPPLVLEPLFAFELHRVAKTNITALLFGAGFGIIEPHLQGRFLHGPDLRLDLWNERVHLLHDELRRYLDASHKRHDQDAERH